MKGKPKAGLQHFLIKREPAFRRISNPVPWPQKVQGELRRDIIGQPEKIQVLRPERRTDALQPRAKSGLASNAADRPPNEPPSPGIGTKGSSRMIDFHFSTMEVKTDRRRTRR